MGLGNLVGQGGSQRPTNQSLQDFAQRYMNYSGPIDNSIYQGTLAGTKAGDTMWNTVNSLYNRHSGFLGNLGEASKLPGMQDIQKLTPQQQLEFAIKNKARYNSPYTMTIGDNQIQEQRGNEFDLNHIIFSKERPYAGGRYEGDTWVPNEQTGPEEWKATEYRRGAQGSKAAAQAGMNLARLVALAASIYSGGASMAAYMAAEGASMASQAYARKNKNSAGIANWINAALQAYNGNYAGAAMSAGQGAANQWGNKDMQRIMQGLGMLYGARNIGSGTTLQNLGTGLNTIQRGMNLYNRIEQGK